VEQALDSVEQRVCQELEALVEDGRIAGYNSSRHWTGELKSRLARAGRDLGYEVRGTMGSAEWLYDLSWVRVEDNLIRSVELVLESEWTLGAEAYDFDKLLAARANHRVMVFTALKREGKGGSIDRLIRRLQAFQQNRPGDRYLFAAWVNEEKTLHYRLYVT
jgi:hypothetical protein